MRSLLRSVCAAATLFLVAACDPPVRPELPKPECTLDSECAEGTVCRASRCAPQCAADRDCFGGRTCQASRCELPAGKCELDADCQSGQACAPNGACQQRCTAAGECGSGYACLGGLCLTLGNQCVRNADCAPEEGCTAAGECAATCSTSTTCSLDEACSSGLCVEAPVECQTSAACTAPATCGPQGRCGAACSVDRDCGAGQRCNGNVCQFLPPQCVRNSDCPAAQACVAGSCADACVQSRDCATGDTCSAGACVATPAQCTSSANCTAPLVCGPLGQCASQCSANQDCGPSQRCTAGSCELLPPTCVRDSDCATAKACVAGSCQDQCVTNQDCAVGNACSNGACSLPSPQCLEASHCDGGACSPAGQCVQACPSGSGCAGGSLCSNGACVTSGPTTGTVLGQVRLTGLTNHAGVQVTARGPGFARAVSAADGGYQFLGLPPGRYGLSLEAPFTLEGRADLEVFAQAGTSTQAPLATFTPAGEIRGVVTLQGAGSHTGIRVFLSGTPLGSVTDSAGNYAIPSVPVGSYQLVATYPGYDAVSVNGVAVSYGNVTAAPSQSLPQTAVSNQGGFAFTSVPNAAAKVGQSYGYTLRAGGGGVLSVVYGKSAGPAGLTVDAVTGVVGFTPKLSDLGSNTVAFSAQGGGQTVYQVFTLEISGDYAVLLPFASTAVEQAGDFTWALTGEGLHVLRPDGGSSLLRPYDDYAYRPLQNLEVLNGGRILGINFPSGYLTSVEGPVGELSASWPGGKVGSITPLDRYEVTSARREGGHVDRVDVLATADRVTAVSVVGGVANQFFTGLRRATSVQADTGVADAVTATVLTDNDASWPAGTLVGRCLINVNNSAANLLVTANTATTITIASGDLTGTFQPGSRYFVSVGNCTGATNRNIEFRVVDSTASFDAGTVNPRVDIYPPSGAPFAVSPNAVTADTLPVRTTANFWPVFQSLTTTGRFALGTSAGHVVRFTTATTVPPGLTGQVMFGELPPGYPVVGSASNEIQVGTALGTLSNFADGVRWRALDSSGEVPLTFTLADGGFTPGDRVGTYVWSDSEIRSYLVTGNGTNTVTFSVPTFQLPAESWVGEQLLIVPAGNSVPEVVLTDADGGIGTLSSNLLAKLYVVGPANFGTILSSTDTTVTFRPTGSQTMAGLRSAFLGSEWVALSSGRVRYHYGLDAGFEVGALAGSQVLVAGASLDAGTVLQNGVQSVMVEVAMTTANAQVLRSFDEVVPGAQLIIPQLAAPGVAVSYRFGLADQLGGHDAGQWRDHFLVPADGGAFPIRGNGAGLFEISVPAVALPQLPRMEVGSPFAIARAHPAPSGGCPGGTSTIPVRGTLAGAILNTPGTYDGLFTPLIALPQVPLVGHDSAGFDAEFCPTQFPALLGSLGRRAALTSQGRLELTGRVADGGFTPGALVGLNVIKYLAATHVELSPVTANTTERFTWTTDVNLPLAMAESRDLPVGNRVTFADPVTDMVPFELLTDLANLPQGSLTNTFVGLQGANLPAEALLIESHDGGLLRGAAPYSDFELFDNKRFSARDHVTVSSGVHLRFRDSAGGWVPGRWVGETVELGGYRSTVLSNTADQFEVVYPDEGAFAYGRDEGYFYMEGLGFDSALAGFPNGAVLVAKANSFGLGAYQVGTDGKVERFLNPLTTGRKLQVTPVAPGPRFVAENYSSSGDSLTFTNAAWNFPAGQLVGQYLRAYRTLDWGLLPIIANSGATITVLDNDQITSLNYFGRPVAIDPYALDVQGPPLVPGELAGQLLQLNGRNYTVRSNTASRIQLVLPADLHDDELPPLADPRGQAAWVVSGINDRPRHLDYGPGGISGATTAGVFTYDGGSFSHYDYRNTGTIEQLITLGAGAVRPTLNSGAFLTPGHVWELDQWDGYQVITSVGPFRISDTAVDRLRFTSTTRNVFANGPPLINEVVELRRDSLQGTSVLSVSATGGVLFASTNDGVFRLENGASTRMTVSSTESSLFAHDGLQDNYVEVVEALSPTDLWFGFSYAGVQHLLNGTWLSYTVRGTESAPGLADGLPSDDVVAISTGSSGVWVATGAGVGRFFANDWTAYGADAGIPSARDVAVLPSGQAVVSTPVGLLRVNP